jgi:hypothetical protein
MGGSRKTKTHGRRERVSSPDWIGRAIALLSLGVWVAQLLFSVADRKSVLAESLFVELLPSAPGATVEVLCHPDGRQVVVGFPFEGRILNTGKSATTATSWLLEGIGEGTQTPSRVLFQGATVFAGHASGTREDVRFPVVLAPGESLRFVTSLRVTVVDPPSVSALASLVRDTPWATITAPQVAEALPDSRDLCGNPASLPLGRDPNVGSWIKVRFSVWTSHMKEFGYAFLWAPPRRVEQCMAVSTRSSAAAMDGVDEHASGSA